MRWMPILAYSPYLNPTLRTEPSFAPQEATGTSDRFASAKLPPHLQAMLSTRCLLYGVRPDEASWADYSLVAGPYFQSSGTWKAAGPLWPRPFADAVACDGRHYPVRRRCLRNRRKRNKACVAFFADGRHLVRSTFLQAILPNCALLCPRTFAPGLSSSPRKFAGDAVGAARVRRDARRCSPRVGKASICCQALLPRIYFPTWKRGARHLSFLRQGTKRWKKSSNGRNIDGSD